MPTISATVPLLTVSADAKPSNYLVNHVSWAAPTENINWSEVCVLRSTSGFPTHVNDGVTIFSEREYSLAATVTAVHSAAALETVTFSGGGLTTSGLNFEYYTAVKQSSVLNYQGLPTSVGTGATFDVTRTSAYLGGVASVEINSPGGGYQVGDIITLSKNDVGYLNSDGSLNTYGAGVANITVLVSAVTGATSGIKTVTLNAQPGLQSPAVGTFTYNNVTSFATDSSVGNGATFDVVRVGDGSTANTSISIRSSGANYKVNDIVRIPGYLIGGRVNTTELGTTNAFHIYDKGLSTAATTNPGYEVTGTDLRVPKYYYSVFVKYTINDPALSGASNFIPKWSKIAEVSSYAIKDTGTLDTILGHLPLFYRKNYQGKENKDLKDFISLFAFHYDIYLASSLSVFNSASISTMDNNLVVLALKQFGFDIANVASISQARTLLGLLIRSYQNSGSLGGIADFVEGLTGYGSAIVKSRNLLNDCDTSSFVDGTGFWYLDPNDLGNGTLALAGTVATTTYVTLFGTQTFTIGSYANERGRTVDVVNSSGYTITLSPFYEQDLDGITSGTVVTVPTLTATTGAVTSTTSTTVTTTLSVTGQQLQTNHIVRSIVDSTGAVIFTSTTGNVTITATTSGTVTLSTTPTALTITPNSRIITTRGVGSLAPGTVVTAITGTNTFKVNTPPTVPLVNQSLVTSTNLNSNLAKATTAAFPGNVRFFLGLKEGFTTATAASGTNVITVRPALNVSVGDTVLPNINSKTNPTGTITSFVPVNTKITAITYLASNTAASITLSNRLVATMPNGTTQLFAPSPTKDAVGAFSSLMPVSPSNPYAFSFKANACGTNLSNIASSITWYDKALRTVSTTSRNTLPTIDTDWTTVMVAGVAPSNALYARPSFSVPNNYFVDAMQFEAGINANAVNIANGTVSITTDLTHNFETGNIVSVSGYGPPMDGNFTITGTQPANKIFSYELNARSIISVTPDTPAGITMTGASSSGAVITVSSNTGLSVGDAIKITSGTGAFNATNPTYVTGITSTTTFTVDPVPVTPLSGATIKTGYVTYGTNNNNFVPGNIVNIATIAPAGYTTTTGFTIISSVQGTNGNFVIANTTTTAAVFSQTSAPILVWGDPVNYLFAKAAINQSIQGNALVASQSLFEDARTTQINVLANRRNLILNPSFETGVTSWSVTGLSGEGSFASSSNQAKFGFNSGKLDINATSATNLYVTNTPRTPVNPSSATSEKLYTASAYLKRTAGAGITYVIQIAWFETETGGSPITSTTTTWTSGSYYNSSDVLITQAEGTPVNLATNTGWNRLFVTGKAPANAGFAEIRIIRKDTTGNASTVYVDGVLFEPLSVLKHYFDGSFDGQNYIFHGAIDSTWEGTDYNSVSHLYYNRVFNTGKIDSLVTDGTYYA